MWAAATSKQAASSLRNGCVTRFPLTLANSLMLGHTQVPQMATTTEVVSSTPLAALRKRFPSPELTFPCLVPNLRGLSSLAALPQSSSSAPDAAVVDEIALFAAATEGFSKANLNSSVAESLDAMSKVAEKAKEMGLRVRGYVSTAVGCPYEGAVAPEAPARVTRALLDMYTLTAPRMVCADRHRIRGCYEVSVADTVGVATPPAIISVLEACERAGASVDKLAIHCHDTFGSALANVLAAVGAGVRTVDASVGGVGGCPYSPGATGSRFPFRLPLTRTSLSEDADVATEDVVYALASSGFETALLSASDAAEPVANDAATLARLEPLAEIGQWINDRLGRANSSRVGRAVLARKARREAAESGKAKL